MRWLSARCRHNSALSPGLTAVIQPAPKQDRGDPKQEVFPPKLAIQILCQTRHARHDGDKENCNQDLVNSWHDGGLVLAGAFGKQGWVDSWHN